MLNSNGQVKIGEYPLTHNETADVSRSSGEGRPTFTGKAKELDPLMLYMRIKAVLDPSRGNDSRIFNVRRTSVNLSREIR
jgi:hypothetical protein